MARRHAWELDDRVNDEGDLVPAYEQLVDLTGSLLDMLSKVGGKVAIAAKRDDTGQSIAGIKVFETTGYVVVYDDHVPGVPAESAAAEPAEAE